MKNRLSMLIAAGFVSSCLIGFTGCEDKSTVEEREKVTSPTGTTTTTTTKEIKSSGSNPPVNSEGEKVDPK
jgi:hypothetical protein